MRDSDIDSLSADGAQEEANRAFDRPAPASAEALLRQALRAAEQKQEEWVARFRRERIVFVTRIDKPWHDRTDAEKWEHVAFLLYNDIVDIHLQARAALQALPETRRLPDDLIESFGRAAAEGPEPE